VARAEAYLHAKFHLDPSNPLATIHQRHRQDRLTGQTDRQRSDSIGRTVLQTVAQKWDRFLIGHWCCSIGLLHPLCTHLACKKMTAWWGAGTCICLGLGADLHIAQLMPLPPTVSCFSKTEIGFIFLVLAHPSISGPKTVKQNVRK